MKNKEWKDVREVEASGKPTWRGGAYTIAFVYSNKGNFIVKGFLKEVEEYLEAQKRKGYKYIVNLSLWSKHPYTGEKGFRDIWTSSCNAATIMEPSYKDRDKRFRRYKWSIYRRVSYGEPIEINLKRFPNKWIPEFDDIII